MVPEQCSAVLQWQVPLTKQLPIQRGLPTWGGVNPKVWHMPTISSYVHFLQVYLFRYQSKFRKIPNYKHRWHKAMKKIAVLIVSQNVPTCCLNSSWSFDSSIWHKVGWNEFVPVFDSKLFWWVLTFKCLRLDRCHSMVPDFLKGKGNIWESKRWHLAVGGPTNLTMLLLLSSVLFLGVGWHLKQHPIIKSEVHFGSSMIQPTMGGSAL